MIKEIKITNFYGFKDETVTLQPDVNIIIGINGSGKSNFFKAVQLLKEGISGIGLRAYIYDNLGGFDNIFYKGVKDSNELASVIELKYTLDGIAIANGNYGFHFTDDLIYTVRLIKSPGVQNFYVNESLVTKGIDPVDAFVHLDFNGGSGYLIESANTTDEVSHPKRITYNDFNAQELVLREISDSDRYFAQYTVRKAIKDIVIYDYFDTTPNSAIRKLSPSTSAKRLNAEGSNLTQILNTLKNSHKKSYKEILKI